MGWGEVGWGGVGWGGVGVGWGWGWGGVGWGGVGWGGVGWGGVGWGGVGWGWGGVGWGGVGWWWVGWGGEGWFGVLWLKEDPRFGGWWATAHVSCVPDRGRQSIGVGWWLAVRVPNVTGRFVGNALPHSPRCLYSWWAPSLRLSSQVRALPSVCPARLTGSGSDDMIFKTNVDVKTLLSIFQKELSQAEEEQDEYERSQSLHNDDVV